MGKSSAAVQRKEQKTKGGEVTTIDADQAKELTLDGEVGHLPEGFGVSHALAVALTRAEIDQQITTARALPRDIKLAMRNINMLATLDEQTSKECIYALPRGGKSIRGPSIRLAEIIFQNWGNCRAGARVVHVDRTEKYVEAEGQFHDLQTNALRVARTRRPIVDSMGRLYNDDMINVTSNAAQAIAMRNAILAGVPRGVWRQAYEAVERVLAGNVKTLNERRATAVTAFATWGITPDQLVAKLGVKAVDDISNDDVVTLVGLHSAIRNSETTVEEEFKLAPKKPEPDKNSADGDSGAKGKAEGKTADSGTAPADNSSAKSSVKVGVDLGAAEGDKTTISKFDKETGEVTEYGPADAMQRGRDDHAAGKSRKAVPPEFREPGKEHLAEAWLAGWDDANDISKPAAREKLI